MTDTFLFSCWTEGNSTPYSIAFNVDTVQGAGFKRTYYVDAGKPIPSPYLIHRGGYQDWGGLPQLTVDTDPRVVSYRFTGLDGKASYHFTAVHYFDPSSRTDIARAASLENARVSSPAVENNVAPAQHAKATHNAARSLDKVKEVVPVAPANLVLGIRLDGESCGEVDLSPRLVTTFECEVPQASVADGSLTVEVARIAGACALVSELYLCQVEGRDAGSVETGAQLRAGLVHNRFRFHGLSPNPSRGDVTLSYEIAARCDVTVHIFDVAGRLTRDLSQLQQAPGAHSVAWNQATNPNRRVASGVYFVRLTAVNTESGRVELSSTKKLVVLR